MAGRYLRTLSRFSHELRIFLVTAVLVAMAWDGVRAVLFNLYLLRLDYGPQTIGMINAAGGLAFALMCLPAGALGTRRGSRAMLVAGLAVLAAGIFLLPLAELLAAGWRTAWLLAMTFLQYLGLSLYYVNSLPFLMEVTGAEERSHAFSVHIALVPISAFAGSLLAGLLPGVTSGLLGVSVKEAAAYRFPLWLSALLLVPAVLLLVRTWPGSGQHAPQAARDRSIPRPAASIGRAEKAPYGLIITIGVLMALRFAGRGTVATFFNVYLDDGLGVPPALIGTLAAIAQLLSVPAALLAPLVTARWGATRAIFWGGLGMALFVLPLALVPHWAAAGAGFAGTTALFMMTGGPLRLFGQELVAPRWRAIMASSFMLGQGLAFAAASLAAGYMIVSLGYPVLFLAAAGFMGAAALFFWSHFRSHRQKETRRPITELGE
jgi:hypothetical protein